MEQIRNIKNNDIQNNDIQNNDIQNNDIKNIREKDLVKIILKETKKSYQARKDSKGKPIQNIANYGLKKDGIAVRANDGEYSGFSVQVIDEVKPLLTDFRVANAINKLSENNIQGAISILNISSEVEKFGIGIMYEIIKIWLEKNDLPIPEEYQTK